MFIHIYDKACNRHSNETVTFRKHVSNYINMRKWMIEFFKKIENRGIKIARVNYILITNSLNLQLLTFILYGVGVRCDRLRRFSVHSLFIEKSVLIDIHMCVCVFSVCVVCVCVFICVFSEETCLLYQYNLLYL